MHFPTSPALAVGFHARELAGGSYCFTLTSLLGDLISLAESHYGERNKEWTLLGVEFSGDHPYIWYPHPPQNKQLIIRLSENALNDIDRCYFQLAHEAIHVLSPSGGSNALVFEEGLATAFSHDVCAKAGNTFRTNADISSYMDAEKLVRELLALDKDSIKEARKIERDMWKFTPEVFLKASEAIPNELAKKLCEKFVR